MNHAAPRIFLLSVALIAAMVALGLKLWNLQVVHSDEFKSKAPGATQVSIRVPGVRGEIKDRHGVTLVTNRVSYEIDFYLPDIVESYLRENGELPKRHFTVRRRGMIEKRTEADIVAIVKSSIIPRLEELGLAVDFNAKSLRAHYSGSPLVPFTYRKDISFAEMAKLAERNLELPGVVVTARPRRKYLYDALAAHILGHVKLPDIQRVSPEERNKFHFYVADDFGGSGIEKIYDEFLKGKPGKRILKKNPRGVIEGEIDYIEPQSGDDIYLTIDARIQTITEQALRKVGMGAAVVIEPSTGDILAMASVPSFNPNAFIPSISKKDWDALVRDKTHPMVNRALAAYPPGSTFKIPIAFAGLLKGLDRRSYYCNGSVTYGNKAMKCWILKLGRTHQSQDLSGAIKNSCNCFFYQYANEASIYSIEIVAKLFGLGMPSGLGFAGEDAGIVPGPNWLKLNHPLERWSSGTTANVSIGQGYTITTPIQIAQVAATVANGGISYYPRIVSKIVSSQPALIREESPRVRANLLQEGFRPDQVEKIRHGMYRVVNEAGGTARSAQVEGTTVAGKTGTSQSFFQRKPDTHAWFMAFAPYEEPRFAVCVFVQRGKSGGGVAAPIAAKIIEESLALDLGQSFPLTALAPAVGNTDFVESVSFPNTAESGEVTSEVADNEIPTPRAVPAVQPVEAPSVALEADTEGIVVRRAIPVERPTRPTRRAIISEKEREKRLKKMWRGE